MHWPCTWKEWSELAQVVAVVGGLAFFGLKALFGYFMINLSIEPIMLRQRGRDRRTDHILLTLKLTKGDREGVMLQRIVVRPSQLLGNAQSVAGKEQIEVFVNPIPGRTFKISPGEIAYFSYHLEEHADAVCKVDIEVFGASGFLGRPSCYWKVSAVSLPRTSDA
jgi:hypothetical protein